MEKSFWEENETSTCSKYDRFDSHIVGIYTKYFELQSMIKELPDKFNLKGIEAQQELRMLISNFENGSLSKMVRNLLMLHKNDVAVNQDDVFKACPDDQTGTCCKHLSMAISCEDNKFVDCHSHEVGYSIHASEGEPSPANGNYSNLDATVLDSKLGSASTDILASSTKSSVSVVNDQFQDWPDYPKHFLPIGQPSDHPILADDTLKNVVKIWDIGKNGSASLLHSLKLAPDVYSSLEPVEKVVGDIINGYYNLIVKRSGKNGLPSVTVAKDYFLDLCASEGIHAMPYDDINFDADIMLVPMHKGEHWYTCLVDMRPSPKHIEAYDSLYSGSSHYQKEIMRDLSYVGTFLDHHITRKGRASVKWQYSIMKNAPQQKNDVDCGVFTCKNGDYLATDHTPAFDQTDILYHRHQIVVELEAGNLTRLIRCGTQLNIANY